MQFQLLIENKIKKINDFPLLRHSDNVFILLNYVKMPTQCHSNVTNAPKGFGLA